MKPGVIDLDLELQGLFDREKMRAFFEVTITLSGGRIAEGMCKVSEPKSYSSEAAYLSLLFLIDAPDKTAWEEIDFRMGSVGWQELPKYLPLTESVVPMPMAKRVEGIYLREVYLYTDFAVKADNRYIADRLIPSIARVTGFSTGEPVLWEGETRETPASAAGPRESTAEAVPPFILRLKRLLK